MGIPFTPEWWGIQVIKITSEQEDFIKNRLEDFNKRKFPISKHWTFPYKDKKEQIWLSSYYGGLYKMNQTTREIEFESICDWIGEIECPWDALINMSDFDENQLLISCFGPREKRHVGIYDLTNKTYKELKTGIPDDSQIYKTYRDSYGDIWLGVPNLGLYQLKPPFIGKNEKGEPNSVHFNLIQEKDNEDRPEFIRSIKEDEDGNLWIGTKMDYLFKIRIKEEVLKFTNFAKFDYKGGRILDDIFQDSKGNLWIQNFDGIGFIQYNPEKDFFKFHTNSFENVLFEYNLIILKEKEAELLMLGDQEIIKFNLNNNKITRNPFQFQNPKEEILNGLNVDDENILLLGTERSAVLYNLKTKHTTKLKNEFADIVSVFKDKNGLMWWADQVGIYTYDIDLNTLDTILLGVSSYDYAEDELANGIWLGTPIGLKFYNKETKKIEHFDEEDGLINTNIAEMIVDEKGMIWIFTFKGFQN